MVRFNDVIYDPKKFLIGAVLCFFVLPLSIAAVFGLRGSQALTIDSTRDCDANAVIRCGALNFSELQNRYSQVGVAEIYASFGISASDIANIGNTAVAGTVTDKGNVWISRSSGLCPSDQPTSDVERNNPNLCLVATDAMTAGRQNIAGSSTVTQGGVTFYRRPPSVSFVSSSLPAFVAMSQNNRFMYAIIASCGNPVSATPVTPVVAKPKPTPQPQPKPQPQPTTPPATTTPTVVPTTTTITNNNSNTNVNNNTNTVNVVAPQPAPVTQAVAAQPAPAAQPQPASQSVASQPVAAPQTGKTTLPNTGPSGVLGLTGLSTVFGTIGHVIYRRRRLH